MIGHCECHGVQAQGPNGIIRGNRFEKTRCNAIRLLTSGTWNEGSGAQKVVVANNIVRGAGADTKRWFVWAAITVYAELEQ